MGLGRDNLQRISQISAEVEKLLNVQGVSRYDQVSGWGPAEVSKFDRLLGSAGRIARENWIEQAQILARGGETAYSRDFDQRAAIKEPLRPARLAEAIQASMRSDAAAKADADGARRPDVGSLRSVRSEAFRADGTAGLAPGSPQADDLKRIRGIGVLIEKRLNALGVRTYEQIANWTSADIERVSRVLDFKGRIERESWVEQARILASGGQTEFARRVERGEVETSRSKS
jgi:predicted flap endonuclease-1-like 5' DNA nuclease